MQFKTAWQEAIPDLVNLYNSSWINPQELEKFPEEMRQRAELLRITREQLASQLKHFPEGQIVGIVRQQGQLKLATMLNTLVWPVGSIADIPGSYREITAERTFAAHVPPARIPPGKQGVLFCVSIAAGPEFRGLTYAQQTIEHGVKFAERRGLLAVPYSAPRGFGVYKLAHPNMSIEEYLLITRPPRSSDAYRDYCAHLKRLNHARRNLFRATYRGALRPLSHDEWQKEAFADAGSEPSREAFLSFLERRGVWFEKMYGKLPTVVDYIRLTGRHHIDPVMNFHIQNGADFIYDGNGDIACIFANSRPEDIFAAGYNICLTYSPSPLFRPKGV
ncbi:MAG: hypothetical protein QXG98_04645 [Candidatus Micrarchaeia archaeon]